MTQLYVQYENKDALDLDELIDFVLNGGVEQLVLDCLPYKDEIPLGALSMPLTKPYNGLFVQVLIDLNNVHKDAKEWYKLRVCDEGDGFMDVRHDLDSLQMIASAIKNNIMPLWNVNKVPINIYEHWYCYL